MTGKDTMNLSAEHKLILKGKICPYCKQETELIDSVLIYGKPYGLIYACRDCDAYVGVHKGTTRALGRLANKELRELKKKAHHYFDKLWMSGQMTRTEAYSWLSLELGLPISFTHIGMFGPDTCKEAIHLSKNKLKHERRQKVTAG